MQFINSEVYQNSIDKIEDLTKKTIFSILIWSFISGSKNLDFLWSYLGTLQLLSHLVLLKIQIPMNAILMAKALLSVSLLDIKLISNSFFKNSVFVTKMIDILNKPKTQNQVIKDVEQEISQYQFFELEYKETLSFFDNLRTSKVWLVFLLLIWLFTAFLAVLVFLRIFRCKRRPWFPRAVVRRFWYYLGVNGLIRLLIINFILVIFAGYVVY